MQEWRKQKEITSNSLLFLTYNFFILNIKKNLILIFLKKNLKFISKKLVGRVGYAPTTPAMSMQYSTIELTAHLD